ncbi:ATP-dependent RNA helicase DRS1 [Rhynchospora pubera]|uniref:ATP-dependent RNA helicase DRS1 n=1 Tax=Rhynchospora pubera TaxID=906938 RepID=A0AAV8CWH1_9POAL|nr:ATP-dependent RNA helicase DRS1 [Rhynchospora pubera]
MDPNFRFDPDSSSDEEEAAVGKPLPQSPWEFSAYLDSAVDENTGEKIDARISRALQERPPLSHPDDDDDDDTSEEGENEDDSSEVDEEGEEEEEEEEGEDEVEEVGGEEEEEEGDEEVEKEEEDGEVASSDDESDKKGSQKTERLDPSTFFASSEGASFHANSFLDLNLSRPLLRACEALGYQKPTPIQAACIPLALSGRDICGSAITGSGKTAAFSLPALERLLYRPKRIPAIRVLILTPARELAVQIHSMIEKLAQFTDIRCCLVVGGLSTKVQEAALRSMPDIVVATPGRIIDHLRNSMSVGLEDLAILILDEADRLLELGFSAEIQELIRFCPKRRQTMLFSATMTEEVDALVQLSLNKPVRLEADPSLRRPKTLTEEVIRIRRAREVNREAVLLALCSKTFKQKVIIFSGTKKAAHRLKIIFGLARMKAAELHGNLTQAQRLEALDLFRKQEVDFLVATDVAARGLDIVGVQTVINFSCPRDVKTYLHRVGRTARAGREGYAVTFVTDDDRSLLKAIAKKAGSQLKNRLVAEKPVAEWCKLIEQMEDQISIILQEEREETILRKAEMEAAKAENMIAHKDEIYSRPKRTWFATEKEKKALAKAAKVSLNEGTSNKVMSAEEAEDLRQKEKRRREREKNLPRKKRRKLEAQREMMEMEGEDDDDYQKEKGKKTGRSVVDVAYRRAKSVKAMKKGGGAGNLKKSLKKTIKQPSRREEMHELFQGDMSESKQARGFKKGTGNSLKRKKSSFKSQSRYKRRK